MGEDQNELHDIDPTIMLGKKVYTLSALHLITALSECRLRQLAKAGIIPAEKVGNKWVVPANKVTGEFIKGLRPYKHGRSCHPNRKWCRI
jgi:hypothetical protein